MSCDGLETHQRAVAPGAITWLLLWSHQRDIIGLKRTGAGKRVDWWCSRSQLYQTSKCDLDLYLSLNLSTAESSGSTPILPRIADFCA